MPRAARNRSNAQCNDLTPCIRLWILRSLVLLGDTGNFPEKDNPAHKTLARVLGLDVCGKKPKAQRPNAVLSRLRSQLKKAESDATSSVENSESSPLCANIRRLQSLLGLHDDEALLLHFVIALHTHTLLAAALNASGKPTSGALFFKTLSVLLALPQDRICELLDKDAPLPRIGMVKLGLAPGEEIRAQLKPLSSDFACQSVTSPREPMELFEDTVKPVAAQDMPIDDFDHLSDNISLALTYLRVALKTRQPGAHLLIKGKSAHDGLQFARLLVAELAMPLLEIVGESQELVSHHTAQAICGQRAGLVLSSIALDEAVTPQMARFLKTNPTPILWYVRAGENSRFHADLGDDGLHEHVGLVLHLDPPDVETRRRWLNRHCGELLPESVRLQLSAHPRLSPRVVKQSITTLKLLQPDIPLDRRAHVLEHMLTAHLQIHKKGSANTEHPESPSKPTDGYDTRFINTRERVEPLIETLRSTGRARICLYGPPGTGKTAFAHHLSRQLGRPLHIKRCSDLLGPYVGESEEKIAAAFSQARKDKGVLLMDEVDSLLSDRTHAVRSWEITRINEMLTQLDEFPGIFMASTNRFEHLDPAVMRRFDLKLGFEPLRPDQAWELLCLHLQRAGLGPPADALSPQLSRLSQLTPGDFAVVENRHRFYPLADAPTWIDALEQECRHKPGNGPRSTIGFHTR